MTEQYYLTDGGHVLISGATGAKDEYGGKTVTANWWFERSVERGWHDLGLFFNKKNHGFIRGERIRSLAELAEAYQSGHRLFNYCPTVPLDDDGTLEEQHRNVAETLRRLPGTKIVVHDEAQAYLGPALNWYLDEAGNLDSGSIRSLVITQRAWNLPERLLGNMPVKIWVGPVTSEGRRFFKSWEMGDAIPEVEANTAPFHWNVTDGGEYQHTNPPVPAEYA